MARDSAFSNTLFYVHRQRFDGCTKLLQQSSAGHWIDAQVQYHVAVQPFFFSRYSA